MSKRKRTSFSTLVPYQREQVPPMIISLFIDKLVIGASFPIFCHTTCCYQADADLVHNVRGLCSSLSPWYVPPQKGFWQIPLHREGPWKNPKEGTGEYRYLEGTREIQIPRKGIGKHFSVSEIQPVLSGFLQGFLLQNQVRFKLKHLRLPLYCISLSGFFFAAWLS